MLQWRHPTSRDLWVVAHPAPSKPRRCCPRSHRSWAFFKTPTHCETSQATTPNYFLLEFRATPSSPTSTRSSSCQFSSNIIMTGGAFGGLQVPPGPPPSLASVSSETPALNLLQIFACNLAKINVHCRDFRVLGWLEVELYLPMYGRSPEGLYTSLLQRLLPFLPCTGVKADVFLQCLTTLVLGGNGLSRPGGN